jgi:hypothetical protein
MSERMPEKMPKRVPERMPERMPEKMPEKIPVSEKGLEIVDITEDAPDTDVQDIFDMVDPDHQTSDLTGRMNNLCKTGGRNVKCLIPKCDVLFLTDAPMKQHLTKAHKMNKKEIAKLMLGVSVSKKSEKGTVKEKEM